MSRIEWRKGMPCRVVEHDMVTRKPKADGKAYEAVVSKLSSDIVMNELQAAVTSARPDYVTAEYATDYGQRSMPFYYRTGWGIDDLWRLMPAEDTATTTEAHDD